MFCDIRYFAGSPSGKHDETLGFLPQRMPHEKLYKLHLEKCTSSCSKGFSVLHTKHLSPSLLSEQNGPFCPAHKSSSKSDKTLTFVQKMRPSTLYTNYENLSQFLFICADVFSPENSYSTHESALI